MLVNNTMLVAHMPVAYQATLPMELSRQEYWNGQPFPSPEDLPNPRSELGLLQLQADFLPSEPTRKPTTLYMKGSFIQEGK